MVKTQLDLPMMRQVKTVHFVGIGGVGMSGIAEVLLTEGYHVSGSDLVETVVTKRLQDLGMTLFYGHKSANVSEADVVVQSTAVDNNNPEIVAAIAQKIPVIPRAEMLAELMRFRIGIAIAGTHGKTTTTSLVSSILAEAGLDPSYVIGGKLNSAGCNAKLGSSPYFVAEADESDASFLYLKPMMAVVTNIDADHMGTYNGDFDVLQRTFIEFLHHLPFYGQAVLCIDDFKVKNILEKIKRPVVTYGFSEEAEVKAYDWHQVGLRSDFKVKREGRDDITIQFNLPGKHNVQNALAAIAIATELKIDDSVIQKALTKFQGVGRRFQMHGEVALSKGNAILIDDYGHHPREIESTIEAIRHVWPNRRLVHVFQPHRYSRTKALFNDFSKALSLVDNLLLLDIYPAGESPIEGITSEFLALKIKDIASDATVCVTGLAELSLKLDNTIVDGDILLMQGAGNIGLAAQDFALKYRKKSREDATN